MQAGQGQRWWQIGPGAAPRSRCGRATLPSLRRHQVPNFSQPTIHARASPHVTISRCDFVCSTYIFLHNQASATYTSSVLVLFAILPTYSINLHDTLERAKHWTAFHVAQTKYVKKKFTTCLTLSSTHKVLVHVPASPRVLQLGFAYCRGQVLRFDSGRPPPCT